MIVVDASRGGSDACALHCSSDLHGVLDCNNGLVQTCPADQGCAAGACVPACESAQANKSNIGCDYYSVIPSRREGSSGSAGACFAAFVVNTWNQPITLSVDRAGRSFDLSVFARMPSGRGSTLMYTPLPSGQLPVGEVAILFLQFSYNGALPAPKFRCPPGITAAIQTDDALLEGAGVGAAFHIHTSAPVAAYDIFPYGGGNSATTSATLLYPTSAWGTNYVGVTAWPVQDYEDFLQFVALQDDTTVTIQPSVAIAGSASVPATPQGQSRAYKINKGQLLQFSQQADLIGSVIESDKPVGAWGGANCMNIPDAKALFCDSGHQQIPHVKALGHEYVAIRYRNRVDGKEESSPWRLVGIVNSTTLTYEPAAPAGAPLTLDLGQVATFTNPGTFVVKSQDDQHPFYMSAHMTGGADYMGRGDPEFVNVIPPQQYRNSYIFFTDPTYPETDLPIVRVKGPSGFAPVRLDCAGELGGWQPVGNSGQYEFTRIDLVRDDFVGQNGCDNGRHEITSQYPFGLTVWGWGNTETEQGSGVFSENVSYAYPGGASVEPITSVVVPPPPPR